MKHLHPKGLLGVLLLLSICPVATNAASVCIDCIFAGTIISTDLDSDSNPDTQRVDTLNQPTDLSQVLGSEDSTTVAFALWNGSSFSAPDQYFAQDPFGGNVLTVLMESPIINDLWIIGDGGSSNPHERGKVFVSSDGSSYVEVADIDGDGGHIDISTLAFEVNYVRVVASPDLLDTNTAPLNIDSIAGSAVPLPAAVWLFGAGLLGLVGIARKHSA